MKTVIFRKKKRFWSFLAIMFFIVAGLSASFHYHEGGKILDNCPLCQFQLFYNLKSDDINHEYINPSVIYSNVIGFCTVPVAAYHLALQIHPHAPPSDILTIN
jgi:hypothetical protein